MRKCFKKRGRPDRADRANRLETFPDRTSLPRRTSGPLVFRYLPATLRAVRRSKEPYREMTSRGLNCR